MTSQTEEEREEEGRKGERVSVKDVDRWKERGFPWHMREFVVCWGVAGAGALNNVVGSQGSRGGRSPKCNGSTDGRGAIWQQSRKQMQVGGTAGHGKMHVRACLRRAVRALRLRRTPARRSSGTQREGKGGSRVGGWKRNSRMLVLQLSEAIYMCSWTPKELWSLFVSLTQYKQITHGPMELAKHRVQCIQKHVSYEEHIHQIIYTACCTKQLSVNARQRAADLERAGRRCWDETCSECWLKGEERFNSSAPQRRVFMRANNCF